MTQATFSMLLAPAHSYWPGCTAAYNTTSVLLIPSTCFSSHPCPVLVTAMIPTCAFVSAPEAASRRPHDRCQSE